MLEAAFGKKRDMSNRQRFTTAVALLAASFAMPVAASAAAIAGVSRAGASIAARTSMPVYLPTTIPNGDIGGGVIRATVISVGDHAYDVGFSQGPCSRPACRFGFARAESTRAPATPQRYLAGKCDGACRPSTLTWTRGGTRYVLGLQGGTRNALRFMAASMRRF